jgi:hypothetical protein
MHAFLDDSGDPGMKFERGSSKFLVMAACIFREPEDIEAAVDAIRKCRQVIGRSERWEFKHGKTSKDMQSKFFECTRVLKYDVRAIVIDKRRLHSDTLISRPGYLQNYAIMQLFSNTVGTVRNAKLVIDGQDRRAFQLKSSSYFLKMVNSNAPGTLRKVEYDDSVRNPLIQLADMTAGAIRRHFEEPQKANALHFAMIKGRTRYPRGSLWEFTSEK